MAIVKKTGISIKGIHRWIIFISAILGIFAAIIQMIISGTIITFITGSIVIIAISAISIIIARDQKRIRIEPD